MPANTAKSANSRSEGTARHDVQKFLQDLAFLAITFRSPNDLNCDFALIIYLRQETQEIEIYNLFEEETLN